MCKTIGYTQGVFDLFHVGHLRLLQRAKEQCDYLIVGVNDDDLVEHYKGKRPIIPVDQRRDILAALRCVDEVVICTTLDKTEAYQKHHFHKIFIGDDWKGNARWERTGEEMRQLGAELIYLSYTQDISTSILREKLFITKQEEM